METQDIAWSKTAEQKLHDTVFFVEANGYERLALWKEYQGKGVSWVNDNVGFSQVVGYIGDDENKPVRVSFTFEIILGSRVCLYHACSRYSDSVMVEEWIEANYPRKWDSGTRRAMTDAMNFHHAVSHCKALAKAAIAG